MGGDGRMFYIHPLFEKLTGLMREDGPLLPDPVV